MDISALLAGLGLGGLGGVLASQIVNFLINKGLIEEAVENAEKVIPDQFEKPFGKLLEAAADELIDTKKDKDE